MRIIYIIEKVFICLCHRSHDTVVFVLDYLHKSFRILGVSSCPTDPKNTNKNANYTSISPSTFKQCTTQTSMKYGIWSMPNLVGTVDDEDGRERKEFSSFQFGNCDKRQIEMIMPKLYDTFTNLIWRKLCVEIVSFAFQRTRTCFSLHSFSTAATDDLSFLIESATVWRALFFRVQF